ncbi:hypothetical protein I350_07859 [Cryptococcus amylolentus CBS 6273]|uniref:Uncharacterized protein n=1 Tax=Cryptococcus amylolentus CBS 6273 TaxID=1296118 RepID=A0A1E3JBG6_9TREE|nr:hypothetical protein I350_07859 [Cryptococcus amylolentus CBS 6273]
MAPQGLVISKLGVQASASGTDVTGLIALKISLPKDMGTKSGARWMIFNSTATPPAITSRPSIHPLPLPLPLSSSSRELSTACNLLSIQPAPLYPPSPQGGTEPYIDVSSTTGKVYVVVDPASGAAKQRRGSFKGKGAEDGRRDWLVILPFSQPLEKEEDGLSKVLLPLPKCLDNVIRFRILSPDGGQKDVSEVSILTDPKLLALPEGTFGEEGDETFDTVDEDEGSSWLEGRFQSTDALRLEWSFTPSLIDPTTPSLFIAPTLHPYPQIALQFSACASTPESITSLEAHIPAGWVWETLEIEGDGLAYWRGIDNDWGTVDDEEDTLDYSQDDSFATVRTTKPRPTLPPSLRPAGNTYLPPPASGSSVSLMRQTLPTAEELGEFSFEMSGEQSPVPKRPNTPLGAVGSPAPSTPGGKSRLMASAGREGDGERIARGGRLFDLYWQAGNEERAFVLTGVLVPEPLTLVPATLPQPVPLFTFLSPSPPSTYNIRCPHASYSSSQIPESTSDSQLVSLSGQTAGTFAWHDGAQLSALRAREAKTKVGDVKIRLQRDVWGMLRMNVLFSLSSRQEQRGFRLSATDADRTRIVRASVDGLAVPRCILPSSEGVEVRIGRKEGGGRGEGGGLAEIVLEIGGGGTEVGLPVFEGEGEGRVELIGEGWKGVQFTKAKSLNALSAATFAYPISTLNPPTITLSPPPSTSTLSSSPLRTLFSLSTLYHLFILWLLLSMGSQVQRLRNEVAFVAGEARDLRGGYGWYTGTGEERKEGERVELEGWREGDVGDAGARIASDPSLSSPSSPSSPEKLPSPPTDIFAPAPAPISVRVWQEWPKRWGRHPTVRTLGKGVKWIWEAVVWLVLPPGA